MTPSGEQLRAHKLILSACSEFFRQLLRRNPAPNPVIVLWDMGINDLRNILRFMYNGEVEVKQAHLNRFLSVAEKLRVRGLCQSDGKPTPEQSPKRARSVSPKPECNAASSLSNATPSLSSSVSGNAASAANASANAKMASSSSTSSASPNPHSAHNLNRRRLSSAMAGAESPSRKRIKGDNEEDIEEDPVKEESHLRASSPIGAAGFGSGSDVPDRGDMEDLNRSRGGSEEDEYTEYGYTEGFDDQTPLQSALMGRKILISFSILSLALNINCFTGMSMSPSGMLDPATAKGKSLKTK